MNPRDRMISYLAGTVRDGDAVSTGVASFIPLLSIALAQKTSAPHCRFIACTGAVNPEFQVPGFSSDDSSTFTSFSSFVTLPSLFDLGVRGEIDVMFFSGAQIDQRGHINLSAIGEFLKPKVKLPGPAGSSVMLRSVRRPVLFTLSHTLRTLVPQVDFVTADGLATRETIELVTELGAFTLSRSKQAMMTARFTELPDSEITARTGFPLVFQTSEQSQDFPENAAILASLDPRSLRYR